MRVDTEAGDLDETEIDAFIGDRWLITVRKDDGFSTSSRSCSGGTAPPTSPCTACSFLLYGLLDVDGRRLLRRGPGVRRVLRRGERGHLRRTPLDAAEQRHWFQMRRALVRFHRLVVPMREAVSGLHAPRARSRAGGAYPYYQDVYDHVLRVSESTDSLRDLVGTIVETNLSLRDYRQNQIMKKVTSWAAIIAVPTLITGYYGMNVPYPG